MGYEICSTQRLPVSKEEYSRVQWNYRIVVVKYDLCNQKAFVYANIILKRFIIPGLTKPALACPVLDTGYLIQEHSVFFCIPTFEG